MKYSNKKSSLRGRALPKSALLFIVIPFILTLILVFNVVQSDSIGDIRNHAAYPIPTSNPVCATGWQCGTQCASTADVKLFNSTWCDGKSHWLAESAESQGKLANFCGGSKSSPSTAQGCPVKCPTGATCLSPYVMCQGTKNTQVRNCTYNGGTDGYCCNLIPLCTLSKRVTNSSGFCNTNSPNTSNCAGKRESSSCTYTAQCGGGSGRCVVVSQGATSQCQCHPTMY